MRDMVRHRITFNKCRRRRRTEAIAALGGKCIRCGFDDYRALQIDHVNGGGREKLSKLNGLGYMNQVIQSVLNGESQFQLLCANCNWIKRAENNEAVGRPVTTYLQ